VAHLARAFASSTCAGGSQNATRPKWQADRLDSCLAPGARHEWDTSTDTSPASTAPVRCSVSTRLNAATGKRQRPARRPLRLSRPSAEFDRGCSRSRLSDHNVPLLFAESDVPSAAVHGSSRSWLQSVEEHVEPGSEVRHGLLLDIATLAGSRAGAGTPWMEPDDPETSSSPRLARPPHGGRTFEVPS
jgi:hypothetical protein